MATATLAPVGFNEWVASVLRVLKCKVPTVIEAKFSGKTFQ